MNIILIGFMGAGKTTIGRKLALRLGYRFLDMDAEIEAEQGRSIPEIFKTEGEPYFRKLESILLEQLQNAQNTVIASGGGAVVAEGNLERMKQIGRVVYLKTPPEHLLERVKRDGHRPLLQVENPEERIQNLLRLREPFYEQADLVVDSGELVPQTIVTKIIRSL